MKNLLIFLYTCSLLFVGCGDRGVEPVNPSGGGTKPNPDDDVPEVVVYHERAKEMYDKVNSLFRINTNRLYREDANQSHISFLWPYDGMVSGIKTLDLLGYEVDFATAVDNFEKYYRSSAESHNFPGYGSSTDGTVGSGTRFYDDNAIAGIEIVDAYNMTKDDKYRERAKMIVAFLRTGYDTTVGPALWWNENEKNIPSNENSNKPACSNGFAINFLLKYYKICGSAEQKEVLDFAKELYSWLHATLKDPSDHCYWNDLGADGNINQTKWTYNTGAMIENGVLLYEITGDVTYLEQATESAIGSYNYFVKRVNNVNFAYPAHDPWFNTRLLHSYIVIKKYHIAADVYIEKYANYINHAYDEARTSEGLFFEDWTGSNTGRYTSLLNQAAVIESFGLLALYYGEEFSE